MTGWVINGWRLESKIAAEAIRQEQARIEFAQEAADIIEAESRSEIKIRTVYRDKIKKIYLNPPDVAVCINDDKLRFIERWNEIARQTNIASD